MAEQEKPAKKKTASSRRRRPARDAGGLRLVVTGCGRSGTKYAAHLLTAAGVPCGHEDVIDRWTPGYGLAGSWRDTAFSGDSSFVAAPHGGALAAAGVTVVHQVRPPLDVIRSIVGVGWLRDLRLPYVAYLAHHVPEIAEQPPGPRRAAAAWLGLNWLAAQHAHVTWRLHDVDAAHVHDLADRAGLAPLDADRVDRALTETPTTTNHRARGAATLDALGPLASRVQEAAEECGVPLETTR